MSLWGRMKSCGRLSIGPPESCTSLQEGRLTIGRRIPSCPTMAHAVSASIRNYPHHLRRSESSLVSDLLKWVGDCGGGKKWNEPQLRRAAGSGKLSHASDATADVPCRTDCNQPFDRISKRRGAGGVLLRAPGGVPA